MKIVVVLQTFIYLQKKKYLKLKIKTLSGTSMEIKKSL